MPGPGHSRDVAGVIAPPPLVFAGFLVAGLALGAVWPLPILDGAVPHVTRYGIGAVLALAGIGLAVAGVLAFRRFGTDVRPDRPTTALVTTGPFAVSRNPLYLSQALVYLGIAIAADMRLGRRVDRADFGGDPLRRDCARRSVSRTQVR